MKISQAKFAYYTTGRKKKPVFLNKVNSLVSFYLFSFYHAVVFWYFDTQVQVQTHSKLNDTAVNETKCGLAAAGCCHGNCLAGHVAMVQSTVTFVCQVSV